VASNPLAGQLHLCCCLAVTITANCMRSRCAVWVAVNSVMLNCSWVCSAWCPSTHVLVGSMCLYCCSGAAVECAVCMCMYVRRCATATVRSTTC
jgi:hypothetical protein